MMNKRERLEKAIAGDVVDRVPAALWRAWPGDDQRAADLARSVIEFQQRYDWDFMNLSPSHSYAVIDYGVQDEWQGAADGTRVILKYPVKRSLDWTELRTLDPMRGELSKQIACVRLIQEVVRGSDIPLVLTVYSPLAQAAHIAGDSLLQRHLRTQPERLLTGLNVLTESTLRFIEALKPLGLAGIYYVIRHADHDRLSEAEYETYGFATDCRILDVLPDAWWFNTVFLDGHSPMFRFASGYRAHAVSWHTLDGKPDMMEGKAQFQGAACCGLDAHAHLLLGTPTIIRNKAREVIAEMGGRRLILSTAGAVQTVTPDSHLRAVREVIEGSG